MATIRDLTPADAPALTATEVAVGVEDDGGLVASARVLTDYVYYANVFDVVVAADRRGDGVGERLLNALLDHSDLQSVVGLSLLCREGLVPFYESVGFELSVPSSRFRRGVRRNWCG